MVRLVKGDVIVVDFPFSNLSDYKKRPAYVVQKLDGDDALVCQVTTQNASDDYSVSVNSVDFERGRLNHPSNIRPNRLFTVDTNIVDRVVGHLNENKIEEVKNKIIEIIS